MIKHTPGPWRLILKQGNYPIVQRGIVGGFQVMAPNVDMAIADARLIAAAPYQLKEMIRYLPIIERAEACPEIWDMLTRGTGIATANGYRAAIAKATGEQQ